MTLHTRSPDGTSIDYERGGNSILRSSWSAGIGIPVRVLNGSRSDMRLKAAARHVTQAVPGADHAELAGQTHNVNPRVLARAVIEWLSAPTSRR